MSQTNTTISRSGHDASQSVVVEDELDPEQTSSAFFDSRNPLLAPPKEIDIGRRKGRKRKLVVSCLALLLALGGLGVLYLLLKVNCVNVRVQADTPRGGQADTKPRPDTNTAENGLSAEAINIARAALGSDASRSTSPSNSAPTPTPVTASVNNKTAANNDAGRVNLSATQGSPAYAQISESNSKGDGGGPSQTVSSGTSQLKNTSGSATEQVSQSRANTTYSIYIDDPAPKAILNSPKLDALRPLPHAESKTATEKAKVAPAVLPPFGTMLPIRTQGVLFTLRSNAYARLELARDVQGQGWSLPKGTVLIGHVSGGEYDRAFVSVIGYLDSRDNKLVKMSGDVLGSDGAAGLQGKRVVVNDDGLKRALRKVASSGVQVAGTMAGALTGRGTVVIDSAGYRLMNPLTDEAGRMVSHADDKRAFIKVEAGRPGYVMVADLPKSSPAIDAPGDDDLARGKVSLTDREVMELILFGTPEELRAATPLMTEEQKRLALKTLTPEK